MTCLHLTICSLAVQQISRVPAFVPFSIGLSIGVHEPDVARCIVCPDKRSELVEKRVAVTQSETRCPVVFVEGAKLLSCRSDLILKVPDWSITQLLRNVARYTTEAKALLQLLLTETSQFHCSCLARETQRKLCCASDLCIVGFCPLWRVHRWAPLLKDTCKYRQRRCSVLRHRE